jgi:alkylation response protein AidB-like acyl-CoA dehydrogenase
MRDAPTPADARKDLAAWEADRSADPFTTDVHLAALMDRFVTGSRRSDLDDAARAFGTKMANEVPALVVAAEAHPPRLERFDGIGNRIEEVVHSAEQRAAGSILWSAGLVARAAKPGRSFEQATLAYLASLEGEMGHLCPAICTTGLIRVLRRSGSPALIDHFVPRLISTDYAEAWLGAQFLTEVQGGSDVGANAAVAEPAGDGTYRITGEKWFCSVADADAFLLLARPVGAEAGTAGLGCFVVPRLVDDLPNGFSIRRLKDKLGTVLMASGEIDFVDALAFPVGDVNAGFKIMVTAMLNTSRWLNAVGNVGIMRRAYTEAASYARHRRAFGRVIGEFPLVRRQVAQMKAEWLAALHSTWALTALDETVDTAIADGVDAPAEDAALHRFLVNANKLACSMAATDLVRDAIEILGGNGAIESFSVLPRLLRDCVVYEQWEGTHNVLTAQVLRDLQRLGTAGTVIDRIATTLKSIADPERGAIAQRAGDALERLAGLVERSVDDPAHGQLHFRDHLVGLVRAFQVAHLLETAESTSSDLANEMTAAAALITGTYLEPAYDAAEDRSFAALVERALGSDLTASI